MTYEEILADIRSPRKKRVILDTDTFNEMDDQYAVAYAAGCEKIKLEAITAAPFSNHRADGFADGMRKSHDEAKRILDVIGKPDCCDVLYGSTYRFSDGVCDSPAARRIIEAAHDGSEPIYVLAIGCLSNIASALKLDPTIKDNMVLVWLGSHCLERGVINEFNARGDYAAAQYVIDSGAKMIILPAEGDPGRGTQVLLTTKEKLSAIKGDRPAARFFREDFPREYTHGKFDEPGWDRIIWDISAPGLLSVPDAYRFSEIPAPIFTDEHEFAFDGTRAHVLYMDTVDPAVVFADLFRVIEEM